MGVQLNLLIHGNPKGWCGWYNEHELDRTELDFLKGFYTPGDKGMFSPCFIIETRTGRSGIPSDPSRQIITYYHLLITEGVSEIDGRASGYVGLTLRIKEAFIPDFLLVYQLLERLFQKQIIGRLVTRKEDGGYRFLVPQLRELEEDFLKWEKTLADRHASSAFDTKPYPQALTSIGTKQQRYALADLLEGALLGSIQDYLIQGYRLIFPLLIPSQRTQQATKALQEQIVQKDAAYESLKQADEQKIEDMSRKHKEQIDKETKVHQDEVARLKHQLQQSDSKLQSVCDQLSQIQQILGGQPSMGGIASQKSSPPASRPLQPSIDVNADQHHHSAEADSSRQSRLLIILVGLVVLLLLIQGYIAYSMVGFVEQPTHATQIIPTKGDPTKSIPVQSSHEIEVAPDVAEAVVEPGIARAETKEEKPQEHIQGIVSPQTPHTTRTNESHIKPSPTAPTTKKSLSQPKDKDKPNDKKEPIKKK